MAGASAGSIGNFGVVRSVGMDSAQLPTRSKLVQSLEQRARDIRLGRGKPLEPEGLSGILTPVSNVARRSEAREIPNSGTSERSDGDSYREIC
jgi:hypothetical protein